MININGVELEFQIAKVETAKVFDEQSSKIYDTSQEENKDPYEHLRNMCDSVCMMFDVLFGEGVGKRVLGTDYDMMVHLTAFEQLVAEKERQEAELQEVSDRMKKAALAKSNRATRRENQR